MSANHLEFLLKYAVPGRHFDASKELHKAIKSDIDSHPWRIETLLDNHSNLFDSTHLKEVSKHTNSVSVSILRRVISHPESTKDIHMDAINAVNSPHNPLIPIVAENTRHPEVIDHIIHNMNLKHSNRHAILRNKHKTFEHDKHIIDSPEWRLPESSGNVNAYPHTVIMHSKNPDTIRYALNHPDPDISSIAKMFHKDKV